MNLTYISLSQWNTLCSTFFFGNTYRNIGNHHTPHETMQERSKVLMLTRCEVSVTRKDYVSGKKKKINNEQELVCELDLFIVVLNLIFFIPSSVSLSLSLSLSLPLHRCLVLFLSLFLSLSLFLFLFLSLSLSLQVWLEWMEIMKRLCP